MTHGSDVTCMRMRVLGCDAVQVYRILLKATACVQPVSCDEAYLDVTGLGFVEQIAASVRQQIEAATGCTASAGMGPNMLVARLATKEGKPNGQYRIAADQVRLVFSCAAVSCEVVSCSTCFRCNNFVTVYVHLFSATTCPQMLYVAWTLA